MIVTKPKKKKKLSRYTVIIFLMSVIFTIISIKLIYIQFIKHEDYKEQANNTSTKFVSEKAARGKILDRNGNILATNTHTYALTYTKTEESDKKVQKWNSAMSPHVPSGCTWMDIYQPIVNAIPDYGDGYKGNKASKYFASDRCLRPDMNMVVFHTIVNNVIFGDPPKDPPEDIDTSMYSVSASLTAYMNKILGPAADSDEKQYTLAEANTNVGKAGAFLGYGDKDYDLCNIIYDILYHNHKMLSMKVNCLYF